MPVRRARLSAALAACWLVLSACAASPGPVARVALLAPFEGRYREVGYNAWYAAQLAFSGQDSASVALLAVDDGGTPQSAERAAYTLAADPSVVAAVVIGYDAATATPALADLPRIIVGEWGAPEDGLTFHLAARELRQTYSVPATISVTDAAAAPAPLRAGEVLGLEGFSRLRPDWQGVVLATSGAPAADAYRAQYAALGPYTPPPNHLAMLTTDAFDMLLALDLRTRESAAQSLSTAQHDGRSGVIRFVDGWWQNAPIHLFTRAASGLIAAP